MNNLEKIISAFKHSYRYVKQTFTYFIYRKPIQTDISILNDSCYHKTHKLTTYGH